MLFVFLYHSPALCVIEFNFSLNIAFVSYLNEAHVKDFSFLLKTLINTQILHLLVG